MAYEGYTKNVQALANSPAIHHAKMRLLVHELSVKNFSIVVDRVAMKDLLNLVEIHFQLYAQDRRFPDNGIYVFLDLADWNKKWQDLQSALDYKSGNKDPKKYPNSQMNTGDSNKEEHAGWDFNDANQVFRNTLRAMSNQLATLEGCLDRGTFETSYHLTWDSIDTVGSFMYLKQLRFRLRGFLVNPGDLEAEAWGILVNMRPISAVVDEDLEVDYIYLWGDRSAAERPRIRLDVDTGRIYGAISVITGD